MQITTRINYDELGIISKKFHDEGEDYAQLLSSTRQKMAALRTEWEGEAAEKFFDEMETSLLPAIQRLSQGLIISQEVLKNIMKTIYEADQETGSFFKDGGGGGEDFGAGKFNDALGGLGVAGGIAAGAGGEDFGAGLFNQAGGSSSTGTGSDSGAGGTSGGSPETTDHFTPTPKEMDPFATPESESTSTTETPPAAPEAGGGGGGGGGAGVSGQGLQGNLDGMGSGLGGQPASDASVGGSSGGAEGLPDHIFDGGTSGGGGSGLPQGAGGGIGGGSAGGESASSGGGGGVVAGVAGVAGSAAVGGAAKILKNKQDNNG